MKEKKVKKEFLEKGIPDYKELFSVKKGEGNFFGKLVKMNFLSLLLSTLVFLFQTAPIWAIPICSANIINLVTEGIKEGSISTEIWQKLAVNAGVMLLLIVQNVPATVLRWKITSTMLRRTSAGIKSAVVRKLQTLSITYHKDTLTGKIQSKFLKDTEAIDSLFHALMFGIIPNVIDIIIAAVISVRGNIWVALFFLLIIPCNVALTFLFRKKIRSRYRDYRINTEKMSVKMSTMLEMVPVTKAHGLEEKEIGGVEKSIRDLAISGRKMDTTIAYFGSGSYTINAVLSAICLIFCAALALKGVIEVGDIVLYQSMFSSLSGGVSGLIGMLPNISSGFEALASVGEVMETQDVESAFGKKRVPEICGGVRFANVSYRYPDKDVFVVKNMEFSVKAGECIAVVGASGSGKSTLMNLIIGFLLPTEGEVLIDGNATSKINLTDYRHHISVVQQSSVLFPGSIRENITYGLDRYTEEELQRVIEMANLNEFVKDLPDGLDTKVGEHGDKLSGGQKQRITIARALIRNPKILILDEATSALDNLSEYHVQQAISRSIAGRTTFIVAHRLSTIRNADRIIVMNEGRAVETGTYEELMEKKGAFYALKQMNERNVKVAEESLV